MVINIFLFLSIAFLFTFLIGKLMEKVKVPWIFAALVVGSLLAIENPFSSITSSSTFNFLAQLGMYFLLFIIGFEIDLKELKKKSKFIIGGTLFITSLGALFIAPIIHFVFGYDWIISIILGFSFSTVGEAILIPILDEFRMVNSNLGQAIIGIGTLDDIIEVITLILVTLLVGSNIKTPVHIGLVLSSLFILFILTAGLTKLREEGIKFKFRNIQTIFLFVVFVLFLFLGIGNYAESTALAALLAGIALKNFVPRKRLELIESEIRTMCYGLFAPLFFLQVGIAMNVSYLINYFALILIFVIMSAAAKLLGSYLVGKGELGTKESVLLGIGLSVRFSTSIIIVKILFEKNLIGSDIYSVIVASSIIFTFVVPVLFSNLIARWDVAKKIKGVT